MRPLLPDDRTSRARIRDEALRLFAEHGPDAVTIRDIAAAAGVSPALVMRHYGAKDGLCEAVDDHVERVFEVMLAQMSQPGGASPFDVAVLPALAEVMMRYLPTESAIPSYLGRLLFSGAPAGSALFRRLHAVTQDALAVLAATGVAAAGADPAVRAAFLLVNDLAVVILRTHLADVLGVDPLSVAGMRRWSAEVLPIYHSGLGAIAAH